MEFQWLEFKIDLKSFNDFLKKHIPKADGIIASESSFFIVQKEPFGQEEIQLINDYINSLDEQTEASSLARPSILHNSIIKYQQHLLEKEIVDYTTLDKKILMNIKLTEDEELWVINYIEAQND